MNIEYNCIKNCDGMLCDYKNYGFRSIKISSNNIDVSGDTAFGLYLNKVSSSNIADNAIYENNALVSIIHSSNPTKDIQNAIDSAIHTRFKRLPTASGL